MSKLLRFSMLVLYNGLYRLPLASVLVVMYDSGSQLPRVGIRLALSPNLADDKATPSATQCMSALRSGVFFIIYVGLSSLCSETARHRNVAGHHDYRGHDEYTSNNENMAMVGMY